MAYKPTYHEDSDADDEYERSVFTSRALPPDFELSPTDSDPASNEDTPTTFTHSGESHSSPKGLIVDWSPEQCADFVSHLGLGQYADAIVDESINGEALVALQHSDLKEMGMTSIGHQLTLLKSVYEVKIRQNVPLEEDHYIPLSAEVNGDVNATQDDIARIIQSIKLRDQRIIATEAELRSLKEDLARFSEENRKLREEFLPIARMAKDRSQPLPTPEPHVEEHPPSPAPPRQAEKSGLSRKWSTKKLFLGSQPKTSPTIQEGRALADPSSLDPSAAAMAASSHLTASITGGLHHSNSPHQHSQPSPTSPPYSQSTTQASRSFPRSEGPSSAHSTSAQPHPDDRSQHFSTWSTNSNISNASTITPERDRSNAAAAASSSRRAAHTNTEDTPNIFKSFRVSNEDPCHKVLPAALNKYGIDADWHDYSLYIVHGDQERKLELHEKPLILFKDLERSGRKPMFMLRKNNADGSAAAMARSGGGTGLGTRANVSLPGGVL